MVLVMVERLAQQKVPSMDELLVLLRDLSMEQQLVRPFHHR